MLAIIENKFVIGRDEFFPFSAEIHYFRVEKRYWSICFERIKKAGFKIISTYVPWNIHEEQPGEFDFRGLTGAHKDLIVFLELAREFGFKVILKPGPWIKAELPNGGLPKYLFTDEAVVARDNSGELVMADNGLSDKPGYQPSYMHPKYLGHIKRYLSGLVEVIQNYIFPKGPVFIMQIDDELCFGGNYDPFSVDYNNHTITEFYYTFLEEKYIEPKKLPIGYGKKIKEFTMVEPPLALEITKPEEMVKYFDWIDFKSDLVNKYVESIRERLESHGVGCFFSINLPWTGDFGLPIDIDKFNADNMLLGMKIPEPNDYCRLGRNLRYMAVKTDFCWSPQLFGGLPSPNGSSSGRKEAFNNRYHRYLIVSALAAGLKGMNHYMFVGRDHWYGAPLGADGTVNENYETIKKLNMVLEHIGINTAKSIAKVGLAYYKPYMIQHHLGINNPFPYVGDLISQNLNPLGLDMMNLKYDYAVEDLNSESSLAERDIYFIPVAEYMSDAAQTKILEAIQEGKNVVLFGTLPKLDENFKPSKILAKGLGLATTTSWAPSNIEYDKKEFRAIRYGYVSGSEGAKILANSNGKVVGVQKRIGKGNVYLFTFDISPKFDPLRMQLLQGVLDDNEIVSPVKTSDPTVDLIAHISNLGVILYLINTDITFTSADTEFAKKVVVSIDCHALGINSAKIKMYDVLDDKELDFTSRELRDGVVMPVGYHEAKIFFIPKK